MRIGIHTTTGDNGRCVIQSTSILSDGKPVSTVTVDGIEFIPKPAEPPAPVDFCERPEPEEGTDVNFARMSGEIYCTDFDTNYHRHAWQRGDLHLTEEDCERAEEMKLLRARAIRARDAINGERGLPRAGEKHSVPCIAPNGSISPVNLHRAISEWRFHTDDHYYRWAEAVGTDNVRRLIEVTV